MIYLVIGITGGSGSGKSAVASILKQYGMFIIDADSIAHSIIEKGKPAYIEILSVFGDSILDSKNEIDRKTLGKIVFEDEQKLKILNQCTHKYIVDEIRKDIENNSKEFKNIVVDAALLIESKLNLVVDRVWIIYADTDIRIDRIVKRDNISYEQAKKRIESQTKWDEISKYADEIIHNNGDFESTKKEVYEILKRM